MGKTKTPEEKAAEKLAKDLAKAKEKLTGMGVAFDENADLATLEALVSEAKKPAVNTDAGLFTVRYRELSPGKKVTRKGPYAHREFTSKKEAEAFAKATGGDLV